MSVLLEETLKVISESHETSAQDVFYPTVDGGFLPDAPSTLVRTGRFHKNIPVIVGWNHDDGSIFADPSLNDTAAFISAQWPTVSSVGIKTLQRLYPISEFTKLATAFNLTPEYFQSTRILRDIFFTCPGVSFAYNVARHGSASYLYELNQTAFGGIFEELGAPFFGVAHGSDIAYVFNSASEVQDDDSTRILASQVSGSWASFGNKGIPWRMEPVGETLPKWPAAFGDVWTRNSSQFNIQVIGGPDAGMVQGEDSLVKRCEYINSQSFSSQIQT
jgi:carboxylesterase type B